MADFLISSSGGGIRADGFILTRGWSMMVCFMAIRNFSAILVFVSGSAPLSSSSSSASASAFSSSSWLWLGTCSIYGCSCLDVCYVFAGSGSSNSSKSLLDSDLTECFDESIFYSSSLFIGGTSKCWLTLSSSSCPDSSLCSSSLSPESWCSSNCLTLYKNKW